jgi:hypothetical protein
MANELLKKYLGDDQVDGTKILLQEGQDIRRIVGGIEVDAIAALESADSAEEAARLSADAALQVTVDAQGGFINDVGFAIDQEVINRAAADVVIQDQVTLQGGFINDVGFAIDQEVINRAAADVVIQDQVTLQGTFINDVGFAIDQEVINRAAADALLIPLSQKGSPNGVATLDGNGLVLATQLPSYVDDVLEAADFASLPVTGEQGKIYVTIDDNKTYRWSGSTYIFISSGAVDSVNGKTGVVTLDSTEINMLDGITSIESAIQSNVSAIGFETADRIAADSAIQSELTTLTDTVSNADAALQLNIDNEVTRATDEEAAIRGEFAAADSLLQGNIDSEAARALAAEGALDVRVTALESGSDQKQSFVLVAGDITAGSVTLSQVPKPNSVIANVGRLGFLEGEHFSISGAVVTFIGDSIAPGKGLVAGEKLFFKYSV